MSQLQTAEVNPSPEDTSGNMSEIVLAAESLTRAAASGSSALENLMQPVAEVSETSRAALAGFTDQQEGTS